MQISTPDWVKHAVFYQIFPDRYRRSDRVQHPPSLRLKPWGTDPREQGFHGGDLYGIVEKLDALRGMGITALYLNPVFSSASNHRYHTFDYYQVDPLLGGNEALRHLLDEAHTRNMYVVLDGVFNHASRGFWQFHHILEEGGNSPYLDWFTIHDWPLHPYSDGPGRPLNYSAWWNLAALPKFNFDTPDVQQYFLDVARYWIQFGADGWRLDVADEIEAPGFWEAFRRTVKETNPEAYIVGEIWTPADDWLQGDRFDATMNYTFAWSSVSFFGRETLLPGFELDAYPTDPLEAEAFASIIERMLNRNSWQVNLVQLNLLDSHDTARVLHVVQDDISALKLCVLFQMTMPGAPCVYYGSEVGLSGGKDPECRESYPWDGSPLHDLRDFYQRAIHLRHAHEVLRIGTYQLLHAQGDLYAFKRTLGDTEAIVAFNTRAEVAEVELSNLPEGLQVVWGPSDALDANTLTIPRRSAIVAIR